MKYRIDEGSIHEKFLKARKPIQIFGGGFGNGKTAAMCIKAIQLALGYPGSNGLIGRSTYSKLNDTIRKEFFKWCPPDVIQKMPTTTDNTCYLKNGTTINFRYISQRGKKNFDGTTSSNLLSATYDWALVDQMEDPEIEYKDFLDLLGRMRGTASYKGKDSTMPFQGPGWLLMSVNPTGNWFYSKLVKPLQQFVATGHVSEDLIYDKETFEPLIDLIEGPTDANKSLDPSFLRKLKAAYKGQMYQRYFLGKWASFEGLVYPEFDRDVHMLPHHRIERILARERGQINKFEAVESFDFGMGVPSAYLLGFTDWLGRVFVVDGFYEPGLTYRLIAERITDLRMKYDSVIRFREPIWADPAIFKKNQVAGETVTSLGDLLQGLGLYIKPGQNAITSGILKVTSYLAMMPNNGLDDPDMPGPNLYYSDNMQWVADEYLGYFWKKNSMGEQQDMPFGRNDHALDATKYLLSRLPDATDLVYNQPAVPPEYMKWRERA